ncbi:hypothetical protein EDB80DRAFT_160292 [Ilyonectria destructans]|nr:hypothetical protein EDB80DRAFT_160292 [Ilyonectria destructans]
MTSAWHALEQQCPIWPLALLSSAALLIALRVADGVFALELLSRQAATSPEPLQTALNCSKTVVAESQAQLATQVM